jgi:hypothetical protein
MTQRRPQLWNGQRCQPFLHMTEVMRANPRTPFFMSILVTDSFKREALWAGSAVGHLMLTTKTLFSKDIADAFTALIESLLTPRQRRRKVLSSFMTSSTSSVRLKRHSPLPPCLSPQELRRARKLTHAKWRKALALCGSRSRRSRSAPTYTSQRLQVH